MPFVAADFNELVSSSNLSPHPHVILHAGLARSCRIHCFKKRRKAVSLERRCRPGRMRGGGKSFCPTLTHCLRRSPLSRGKGYSLDDGFCDFAFGYAQNDRVGVTVLFQSDQP